MSRRDLERLRDLLQPITSPCCGERVVSFNEALASFRELVNAVIVAQDTGVAVAHDLEALLGTYGDLTVERMALELECGRAA
ncbi:MAG TPA: hypothetical protein VLS93_06075 [Anaeromyxobacteraceae bacterium]|nr:hypothetical protein [Anaeromyxobacteraceae bacterium]